MGFPKRSHRILLTPFLSANLLVALFFALPGSARGYGELRAAPFIFYYTEGNERTASFLVGESPKVLKEIMKDTGRFELQREIKVFLSSDPSRLNAKGLVLPEGPDWAAGYAISTELLIAIKTPGRGGGQKDPLTLFKHELAHVLLAQRCGRHYGEIPTWFSEGFSMYQAMEWRFQDTYALARAALTTGAIPLSSLYRGFPEDEAKARVAYIESFSFFLFIVDRYGAASIRDIISFVSSGTPFREAFREATGKNIDSVEKAWLKRFRIRYKVIPIVTSSLTLWMAVTALFVFAYLIKKRRSERVLARWEDEETFDDSRRYTH